MAPLQHHFELAGWAETTIVVRFWLVAGMFVALGLAIFYVGLRPRRTAWPAAARRRFWWVLHYPHSLAGSAAPTSNGARRLAKLV
jgi:hypothetical protein